MSKLVQANAEQLETQHWLRTAATCGYLEEEEKEELADELARIGRMLNSMIRKAHRFCGEMQTVTDYQSPITDHPATQ